jgi:hypothetical protein
VVITLNADVLHLGKRPAVLGRVEAQRGTGVELVVALQQERAGVALPRPDSRPGDRRGELEDARSGRRRRPGGVDRGGVETVARALGENERRLARARRDPALLGRAIGHRRERGGQARVEARPLAGHLGGQCVVQCLREGGHRVVTVIIPAKCSRGGQPAHRPRAALRDRLGEVRSVDRLIGDVVPGQADG